jgi:hypothetical protein
MHERATNGGDPLKRAAVVIALSLAASLAFAQGKAAVAAGSLGLTADISWASDEQIGLSYYVTDSFVVNSSFLFNPWKDDPLPINPGQTQANKGNILGIGLRAYYEKPVAPGLLVGVGGMAVFRFYDELYETLYTGTSFTQDNAWKTYYFDFGPSVRVQYMASPKVGVFIDYTIYCSFYHHAYDQKDTLAGTSTSSEYDYFNIVNDASGLGIVLYL